MHNAVMRLSLLACIAVVALTGFSPGENENAPALPYHCFDPGYDSLPASLPLLDETMNGCKVFLMGEVHGVAVNPEMSFTLLNYFYHRANVRHYLIEYGAAEAYLIQRYLDTGDESWLDDTWSVQMEEYQTFWRKLYRFNQSVTEKVDVIGLDFDNDHLCAKAILSLCPAGAQPGPEISVLLDSARANCKRKSFLEDRFISWFRTHFDAHEMEYADYFGDNYELVRRFAVNYASYWKFKDRDYYMMNNFTELDPDTAHGYFGAFGWYHAEQSTKGTLANRLNAELFPGKVMSLLCCYDSCEYYYRDKPGLLGPKEAIYSDKKNSGKIVAQLRGKCDIALFDIRNCGGCFKKIAAQGQFLLYVRNSKAVKFTPYKK